MRMNSSILSAGLLLALPLPAFAIGDITCETPDLNGVVAVVPLTPDPRDDVTLAKVGEDEPVEVTKLGGSGGGQLFYCVVGPLPPTNGLQSNGGGAPAQAYIEHGLAESASWKGFRFELALPAAGMPAGTDFVLLAVDFDTAAGPAGEYRLAVQSSASGTDLVLFAAGASAATGSRIPVGAGPVTVSWSDGSFGLSHACAVVSGPLVAGARARAVRMGYLGLNDPQGATGELYVRDPAFVAQ